MLTIEESSNKSGANAVTGPVHEALCSLLRLERDGSIKKGQIAHLDKNNSNNKPDNLVYLCLVHHDEYDSTK